MRIEREAGIFGQRRGRERKVEGRKEMMSAFYSRNILFLLLLFQMYHISVRTSNEAVSTER